MKQIVIVGGGGGLGSALVTRLLDDKRNVVVVGRTEPADDRVVKFYSTDATRVDWRSLYLTIEEETSAPIDAVIFVAGTAVFGKTPLIPLESARRTLELNFWSCTTAARIAAEHWAARNHGGKFFAVLSISARHAMPFEAYYSASKAATARFLECLQLEFAHKNIEFVSVFPGLLRTPFRRHAEWYGLEPTLADEGANIEKTAGALIDLLKGGRKARVIGWRERSIDFADRVLPGLYDWVVLRNRAQRLLK
jgi:NAD(P)-dependent dehydrogenase (short-subunit alcohol dehydrogenase family)